MYVMYNSLYEFMYISTNNRYILNYQHFALAESSVKHIAEIV